MSGKSSTGRSAKAPLDREVFVEAAFRLASRPHTLTLTYRDLGKEVGVDPTAIYRHFQSKESLMQELLDRLFKMAHARRTVPTSQWEDCLAEFAGATLDTFLEYPAIAVTATSLTTSGQGELDSIELMLACFSEAGLQRPRPGRAVCDLRRLRAGRRGRTGQGPGGILRPGIPRMVRRTAARRPGAPSAGRLHPRRDPRTRPPGDVHGRRAANHPGSAGEGQT